MKFRNVKVPEGINVSRHNALGDLVILSAGATAIFVVLAVALWFFGGALAHYMPVSWEIALADRLIGDGGEDTAIEDRGVETALRDLAARLSAEMDLPEEMRVRVHYVDSDIVNAATWLGGHLFIFRGLLERMPNENALAMVLGHEIAHAANRDVIGNMGGALLLQLAFALAFGTAPASLEELVVGPSALILLGFSRNAERRADVDALTAVVRLYGHANGSTELFEIFLRIAREGDGTPPELFSSHPLSEDRIARLKGIATTRGWPLEGPTTPLAPALEKLDNGSGN